MGLFSLPSLHWRVDRDHPVDPGGDRCQRLRLLHHQIHGGELCHTGELLHLHVNDDWNFEN